MSADLSPTSPETIEAPDWQAITRDVKCPLCGYNLRGLIEPRCPECGYQFQWVSVLFPERDLHPYLFEHHPRRNIRSFFQTLFRSPLSPAKFWYTLEPLHKANVKRLVVYWAIYSLLALLPVIFAAVLLGWITSSSGFIATILPRGSVLRYRMYGGVGIDYSGAVSSVVFLALFPWFSFLSLLIFQQSMRRSRVRAVHVLRCAIYCGDLVLWFAMGYAIILATSEYRDVFFTLGHPFRGLFLGGGPLMTLLGCGLLAMVLLSSLRLWVAYRAYLRFERATGMIVASQIVALLAIAAILSWTSEHLQ